MEVFAMYFAAIVELFQIPMTIYGFTFSFWNIFLFTAAATIIMKFIGKALYD